MSNRRDFLKNISLATAGGLLAGKAGIANASDAVTAASPVATANKALGLQIYSLQQELYDNLPQRMKELKEMGYVNFELAGYSKGKIGQVDFMEFKKMADDNGIKIVSSHVSPSIEGQQMFAPFSYDDVPKLKEDWKFKTEEHQKLGCKFMIIPMFMPIMSMKTSDEVKQMCDYFNQLGEINKQAGIIFAYHNHNWEFNRVSVPGEQPSRNPFAPTGKQIEDLMIEYTDPALVSFELDVYWTVRGSNDPLEYLKKHANRIKALHIKDTAVLGQSGLLNFENIFNQMYANGVKDFFVELEAMPDGRSQLAGVKDCAAFLQKASFVK
ncbi:sugar phosphate isomerase/epimerase [Parabacteroides sp. PF5-9]|uniref:sugar phosphate isomerase/epimerase family protein n=1 Tax=Parabacteroides sp. PF5-9 TaxID=1742404 RepID=UPI002476C177|nr:sugar phosphate isomerase/epimerase [Parabacteroides sp. PF5-9]MDH6358226.1 sugar phosphate isomerase/epimerase [Parabacteroides sp. PF5-9]